MNFMISRFFLPTLVAWLALAPVAAQTAVGADASATADTEGKSLNDWLIRMHEASRNRNYSGTFVVSAGGTMSSARIWHACEGGQQVERIENLTGAPRSVFRHNDQMITFLPEQKVARSEKRESPGLFPELFRSADSRIGDFYRLRQEGIERVAGVEADIVTISPKDAMRFGYRVWTERRNGLVVKLQTLDTDGKVLEQAAFSELELDAPVKMDKLLQMMNKVEGYRVEKPVLRKTSASAEGWVLKVPVAGFKSVSCYKRPATPPGAADRESLQWIFSDGLASVSIFVEPLERRNHLPASLSLGATQTLTRQLDAYWITVMGEAPQSTLRLFADALARKAP